MISCSCQNEKLNANYSSISCVDFIVLASLLFNFYVWALILISKIQQIFGQRLSFFVCSVRSVFTFFLASAKSKSRQLTWMFPLPW